jgi:primosomal protein N' (replication factor Y) (superfamily II helicase)
LYAELILPLAVPNTYTYSLPPDIADSVQAGMRVEVQFGKNKLYAALVLRTHNVPPAYRTKDIIAVLDAAPILGAHQLAFWQWVSSYYCCHLGEVMNAALPSGLRLGSETRILLAQAYKERNELLDTLHLSDDEFLLCEALTVQNELSIEDIRSIVQRKQVHNLIQLLIKKEIIFIKEELQYKYKPKELTLVRFAEPYFSDINAATAAFDAIPKNAERQIELLLAMIQLSRTKAEITQKELCDIAHATPETVKAMAKKQIFEIYKKEVSRIGGYEDDLLLASTLSDLQKITIADIKTQFETQNIVLLHGVTGSGKTRVYTELIQETIDKGQQVLYLLPEIALTAQIIHRLQKVFGDKIAVYHSKLNNNERVDMWKDTLVGKPVVLSARSGLFLPFSNLGLIIIDEEHDPSYKQHDPAPRYNARDAALYLAHLQGAKVLLGTATPSLETYYNTQHKRYGLVTMMQRFSGVALPELTVVDIKNAQKHRKMHGSFSDALLEEIKAALQRKEQIILFQNRRGYAPSMQCTTCGWTAECVQCDVALTYHLQQSGLRCHYCGYQTKPPETCTACGANTLSTKGLGTEKVEEELQILLPDARIARMDLDTVRGKHALSQLIQRFEEQEIDILVGTQMVTKGLDFENVRLVGVLSADQLLHFPDFRAAERAFQMLTQVSGRAGRAEKRGIVLIQALDADHPVLTEVIKGEYSPHYLREAEERHKFSYPPFVRLIGIEFRHKDKNIVQLAADWFYQALTLTITDKRLILGPTEPGIARVRSYYLMDILLKLRRDAQFSVIKAAILHYSAQLHQQKGYSQVQIVVNVDPY